MGELIKTNRSRKYFLGTLACVLFLLFMSIGKVYADSTEEATTYDIEVASNTLAEANDHMQTVIYVASVCAVCVCVVILMVAGSDARKKSHGPRNVSGQIRTIYKEGR